jgi:uncharacterized protein (TIGR03437 family)
MVWDGTRSRVFVSTNTAILMVNPDTAQVEDTIVTGTSAEANAMAVSDDGTYLYVAPYNKTEIDRYIIQSHALDLTFTPGVSSGVTGGYGAIAMVVLPGQPKSLLMAREYGVNFTNAWDVAIFDGSTQRGPSIPIKVTSLYLRPTDGSLFGFGPGELYSLAANASGPAIMRSVPLPFPFSKNGMPSWTPNAISGPEGSVFDLNAGATIGVLPLPAGDRSCLLSTDPSGTSAFSVLVVSNPQTFSLIQFSLSNFLQSASAPIAGNITDVRNTEFNACTAVNQSVSMTWGTEGLIAVVAPDVLFFHTSTGMNPVTLAPVPAPQYDPSGIIRLPIAANGLAYDTSRNLIWASVPGATGAIGNNLISIDPASGQIKDTIYAGSEPGVLAISSDFSRLFTILKSSPAIVSIDLGAKQIAQRFSLLDQAAQSNRYWNATFLLAVPGAANRISVLQLPSDLKSASSIFVYDSGVRRAQACQSFNPDGSASSTCGFYDSLFSADAPNSALAVATNASMARLLIDNNGIHQDRTLGIIGETLRSVVYDLGRVYSSSGQVVTFGTAQLLGQFAANGIPVVLSELGQVAYLQAGGVTLFDVGTMRPLGTLPISTSSISTPVAAIRAGANAIAIIMNGQIQILPLSSMQAWPDYTAVRLQNAGTGLQSINIQVNGLVATDGNTLAAAVGSSGGSVGNSIAMFNVATGQLKSNTFMGSEPTTIRLSPDGSDLYAWLSGELHVGRYNVASSARDLVFSADPTGAAQQTVLMDLAVGADGGVAVSYQGGMFAIFDSGVPRPITDPNTQGPFAGGGRYQLAFDSTGKLLYGFDPPDLRRDAVSSSGVQWLSDAPALGLAEMRYSGGLLYSNNSTNGYVIDPERSRIVGRYPLPGGFGGEAHVAFDPPSRRFYLVCVVATGGPFLVQVTVYDMDSYAAIGSQQWYLGPYVQIQDLALVNSNTLAFNTTVAFSPNAGQIYLVNIGAIPAFSPVTVPQPAPPTTPGVIVVDRQANDLAYDASRNLIYASTPNSEAAFGDQIESISPASGTIVATTQLSSEPRLLAISSDDTQLFFTTGIQTYSHGISGLLTGVENLRDLDLTLGALGPAFGITLPVPPAGYAYLSFIDDLAAIPGQPTSVAVLTDTFLSGPSNIPGPPNPGPSSLIVYDGGTPRASSLSGSPIDCTAIAPGAPASSLYCASNKTVTPVAVSSNGLSPGAPTAASEGSTALNGMVFSNGRIYTQLGYVIDVQSMKVIAQVSAQGPVAVDGGGAYWLDTRTPNGTSFATLRSYDASTLTPITDKLIAIEPLSNNLTRLVPCGGGCMAFGAGPQVYIVPPAAAPATRSPGFVAAGVVNSASYATGAPPGGIITIFGSNLATTTAVATSTPLPKELGGTSVFLQVGQTAFPQAAMFYVSPGQINIQLPHALFFGPLTLWVTTPGGTSPPVTVPLPAAAPGIFSLNSTGLGPGAIIISNSSTYAQAAGSVPGQSTRPANRGEYISIYCTGLGALTTGFPGYGDAGIVTPPGTTIQIAAPATASIGGVTATPSFAGLAPGFAGLYQVDVAVPSTVTPGSTVPVFITVGGVQSNTVTIAVQ